MNWLLRAALWARNPPSPQRVKFILSIIVIALVIVGIEKLGLWPEWALVEPQKRGGFK